MSSVRWSSDAAIGLGVPADASQGSRGAPPIDAAAILVRVAARIATRLASSRLIGRSAELAELDAALADAADGRPSLAFVTGESGVGKTRLLAELKSRAAEADALVLAGDSIDLGEG